MESIIQQKPNQQQQGKMLSVVPEQPEVQDFTPLQIRYEVPNNNLNESIRSSNNMLMTNLSLDGGMIRSITFTAEQWQQVPMFPQTHRLPLQSER